MIGSYFIIFVCLQIALGSFVENDSFREQRYDHFSTDNFELWEQRYFVVKDDQSQNTLKSKSSIIFICDKDLSQDILSCIPPFFDSQRRKSNVNMILLEMRYYGQSQPYTSRFLDKDYLSYQSIQQNIADIALFISFLQKRKIISFESKKQYQNLNKLFFFNFYFNLQNSTVVGQDWSGSIATWAKNKYPHLINGVIAFNSQLANISYEQYNQILDEQLSQSQPQCKQQISELLLNLNQQIQEQDSKKELLELFNFKHNIDQNMFLFYFQGLLQKELESRAKIQEFCIQITNKTTFQIFNEIIQNSSQQYKNLFDIQEFTTSQSTQNASQTKFKNSYLPFIRLECSDLKFSKFIPQQENENNENVLFKKIPQYIFQKICKTLFNQKQFQSDDSLEQQFGGINFNYQNTLFINNMDNLSSIVYKNCTKEQQLIDQNNGQTFYEDKVRRCLELNQNGQYIADYINYAIYQWTHQCSQKDQITSHNEQLESKKSKKDKGAKNKKQKVKKIKIQTKSKSKKKSNHKNNKINKSESK